MMAEITDLGLRKLVEDEWEARVRFDPLEATSNGDHRYDDRLPRRSEAHVEARIAELEGFQERLRNIDLDSLEGQDRLNRDIFAELLENEIEMMLFRAYRMPLAKVVSFFTYLPGLHQKMLFHKAQDYQRYISRLNAVGQYIRDHIDLMRAGIREGQLAPRVILDGVGEAVRFLAEQDPEQSEMFKPFTSFPASIDPDKRLAFREEGLEALRDSVREGYRELLAFFDQEYLPSARETIAAANLPDGKEYYLRCIRFYTSLDLTAGEIHQIGMDEVRRIRAEMETVIRQTGFTGDLRSFIDFLRTDPRFYVDTPGQLLKETSLVLKRMDGELPGLFARLPRLPYGIREIPEMEAPGSTAAYYSPGSGDGRRAGNYYVNTYDLKSRPLYEIEALSLHEAVPGHHLQIALQHELDLPNFRRFNGITAFVEGWALYAERLGLEVGFYTDPYSNFGRLSYEMWRACRLVVDTGMHALGWTRQQAIEFMLANTSSTLLNIENEVDRYIAWPGQALAYKLGELRISALRKQAETALGEAFDLRTFHTAILREGAVPLNVLENLVEKYIQSRR